MSNSSKIFRTSIIIDSQNFNYKFATIFIQLSNLWTSFYFSKSKNIEYIFHFEKPSKTQYEIKSLEINFYFFLSLISNNTLWLAKKPKIAVEA